MPVSESPEKKARPAWDRAAVLQALRTHYLRRLVAIVREAGSVEARPLERLVEVAGQYFDDMEARTPRAGFEQARGLTAGELSLVDDEQLEQNLRLGEIARRLYDGCSEPFWQVQLRCLTLLGREDMALKENPVSPDGICLGLSALCEATGWRHEQVLEFLEQLKTTLEAELPVLYGELAEMLGRHQIKPASMQHNIVQTPQGPLRAKMVTADPWQVHAPPGAADPLAALKDAILGKMAATGGLEAFSQGLMMQVPAQPMAPDALEKVLDRLKTLDAFTPTNPDLLNYVPDQASAPRAPAALSASSLGVSGPDAVSVDALALIFEAIFSDEQLAEGARTAIVSLQIPLLKLAFRDRSFFTAQDHPARLTLDRMARLALGLPAQATHEHPVCQQLSRIAAALRAEPEMSAEVFARAVAELEQAILARDAQTQAELEPYRPLLEILATRDQALEAVRVRLSAHLEEQTLPWEFRDFLEKDWVLVLQDAYLQGGEGGPYWQEAMGVVDELLWCATPRQEVEARKRLTTLVPTLLKRITRSLAAIGRDLDANSPFLDACFALQTAALRGHAVPVVREGEQGFPEIFIPGTGGVACLSEVAHAGLALKVVRPRGSVTPEWPESLAVDLEEWLEFSLPDGSLLCGLLADVDAAGALFVNLDWDFAVLMAPQVLEAQLRSGQAVHCNARSLFAAVTERAAEMMLARA